MTQFIFGTSGYRGKIGEELNPRIALQLGRAIGYYLPPRSKIVCGKDNRRTSSALLLAVASGLSSMGEHRVYYSHEPVPTAAMVHYSKQKGVPNAIMVTGSHLPKEDNGIIFFENYETYFSGSLILPPDEHDNWEQYTEPSLIDDIGDCYRELLVHLSNQLLPEQGVAFDSVLIDTANGPAGNFLPWLMQPFCRKVIEINCNLDDCFPNRPSEPTEKNLEKTIYEVVRQGCDFGIATDMDADRVVFILRDGKVLKGDDLGILLARYYWSKGKGDHVIATFNSTLLLNEEAKKAEGAISYSKVGPPAVIKKMVETGAVFGFEGAGKYMFKEYTLVPDAAVSTLVVLAMLMNTGEPLEELALAIQETFYRHEKCALPRADADRFMVFIRQNYETFFPEQPVRCLDEDGLKLEFSDKSWMMIRPSGTENCIRILVESLNSQTAEDLVLRGFRLVDYYNELQRKSHD